MNIHVGIDLAWGTTARSGLAAVDAEGRLIDSTAVVTDEEIHSWMNRREWTVLTAAVDAPLIVTNASGQRACEALVSRTFGAYSASCHSSSLSRPHFNPPRGAVLARAMGWSLDPRHRGTPKLPACVEVYPHAAMVGLFDLGTVLPYKAKGGRSLDVRRSAFRDLLEHMESLTVLGLPDNPRWQTIRETVQTATRPFQLERIEDEIDAILCAYLAWLWHEYPDRLRVYGTAEDGYIVAPPPPAHPASRRQAAASSASAEPVVAERVKAHGRISTLASEVDAVPATFATAEERHWQDAVYRAAASAVGSNGPLPGRLELTVHFRLPPVTRQGPRWDHLDDLITPTLDALAPVLGWRAAAGSEQVDDARVDRLVAAKRTVRDGERPGASIHVTSL